MRNSYFNQNTLNDLLNEIEYVYKSDNRPWVIGYSGGKDSTLVVQLVYQMILNLPEGDRNKAVYIISSDTLVENPIVKNHLNDSIALLNEHSSKNKLPIFSKIIYPDSNQTFWANVIGRGFPTPRVNGSFRWCTDRLKIEPSINHIKKIIDMENREVVILLGVRKDESIARQKRIEGREIEGKLLTRHETLKGAYVYNPIVELTTQDVWDTLLINKGITPWGADNGKLISLYGDADGGECPFATVTQGEQSQSCGKSRFGCWICTVVKEDKSLNGFVKAGHRELIPLQKFRTWLMEIRDKEEYRDRKRRDGKIFELNDGSLSFGPFTWEARQMILKELLKLERVTGLILISEDELKAIDKIWDDELDLSRRVLVELYFNETGIKLPWYKFKKPLFDSTTINELTKLCYEYNIPFDLMRNLVLTTNRNKNFSNPKILRSSLDKILNQQWLHYEVLKELALDYKD